MANQQKGVQQDTAYMAVVSYVSPSLPISFFHVFYNSKMIGQGYIHYNCHIGSILLHSFLLISHPYPSSFHEISLRRQGAPKMLI